jgi:hypothetical protein
MALVKIRWSETVEYTREVEVDGYDGTPDELYEALTELVDRTEAADEVKDSHEIEVVGHEVVREGDEPMEITAPRKQYDDDWED